MGIVLISRKVAFVLGVFALMSSVGGFALGLELGHGAFNALACLMSGVALACYLWWISTREEAGMQPSRLVAAMSFAASGGMALYSNLAWALWAIGVPVHIGTVRDGRMAEHYWLGPVTLVYAVVCYLVLNWGERAETGKGT